MIETAIVSGKIVFRPLRRIRLEGWSGVYAGKLVYDAFTRAGCVVDRGGFFRVTPIRSRPGSLVGGWLAPGEQYSFHVFLWGIVRFDYMRCLAQGFTDLPDPVELVELAIEEKRLEISLPVNGVDDERVIAVVYGVRHLPTFYRFHGAVIAYPSPRRMIASIARRLVDAISGSSGGAEAADKLYQLALRLAESIELYRDETRRQRIRISHGKDQPVFHGYAEYYLVATEPLAKLFESLLEAAKLLGLGGSPGLGLGHIDHVKKLKPRHQPPPSVQEWWQTPVEDRIT